jgi:hypothetical protein
MTIILGTWEAEIGKIVVGGQPWQIVLETPFLETGSIAQAVCTCIAGMKPESHQIMIITIFILVCTSLAETHLDQVM